MGKRLVIIGASGHGKVLADIAIKMRVWEKIVFLDDNETLHECMGMEIVGMCNEAFRYIENSEFIIAIGRNHIRKKIQGELEELGAKITKLIHPQATIGLNVSIGDGTVVMAGAVINCSTTIGKGCIINTGATVDHDNQVMDYVHISPGASITGTVSIGSGTWIGAGSVVINNVRVCSDCIIGAGAVVINDILKPGTYIGMPARSINNAKNTDISK